MRQSMRILVQFPGNSTVYEPAELLGDSVVFMSLSNEDDYYEVPLADYLYALNFESESHIKQSVLQEENK